MAYHSSHHSRYAGDGFQEAEAAEKKNTKIFDFRQSNTISNEIGHLRFYA